MISALGALDRSRSSLLSAGGGGCCAPHSNALADPGAPPVAATCHLFTKHATPLMVAPSLAELFDPISDSNSGSPHTPDPPLRLSDAARRPASTWPTFRARLRSGFGGLTFEVGAHQGPRPTLQHGARAKGKALQALKRRAPDCHKHNWPTARPVVSCIACA